MGDIVHSLPLLHSIKNWNPNSSVVVPLVDKDQQNIPKTFGRLLEGLVDFSYHEIDSDLEEERKLLYRNPNASTELYKTDSATRRDFEKRLYDFYLDGEVYDLAIVPRKFKIDTIQSDLQVTLNDVDKNTYSHMVERALKFADILNIPNILNFDMNITEENPRDSNGVEINPSSDYGVILISSGRRNKNWDEDELKKFLQYFIKNKIQPIIVGSPGEHKLSERLGSRDSINLTYPSSWAIDVENFASLSKNSMCVIGPDTGLLHIADASGAKVIGLYGPTRPEKFGPYNNMDNVISTNNTTRKMDDIKSRDVISRLEKIL